MGFFSALATAFTIGPLTIRWYGIILSGCFLLAIWLCYYEAEHQGLNREFVLDVALILIPSAIIGCRLWYVAFNWQYYAQNPQYILATWRGGLAIPGGIILAILAVSWYCRRKRQSFLRWGDLIVPALALAQSIGRWANYVNHEAYGPVIEAGSAWSWMPFQVYAAGAWHHPLFFYESVWDLLIFLTLWRMLRRPHRAGTVFYSYLIFYSIGRFFLEFLRSDALMLGNLRSAQLACAAGILIGAWLLTWRPERRQWITPGNMAQAAAPRPATGKKKKSKARK